jgi:pimeloyl-ACP methyl ester carboxylesterase/DNA-binding CsgD family transcriptional regulator
VEQRIRFCTSYDGVRIAYATAGEGPPLVRTANWLTHLELDWQSPVWGHWLRALARDRRLIRLDPRGSGLSDRDVGELGLEAWVHDLEAVVDRLGLERFPLLGLCQGGVVAIAYAARHPQRVSRLVLYDTYLRGAFCDGTPTPKTEEARTLLQLIELGWGRATPAFRQVFASLLMPEATSEQLAWLQRLQRRSASPENAVRLWQAFHSLDVRGLAERVQAPTLVFHVRGDSMVPFSEGRRLAARIPDARFVPLEGRNHILLEGEPGWERFLRELESFLADGSRRTGTSERRFERASEGRFEPPFSDLTPREREVLDVVARGRTNPEIAEALCISPKTVRNHLTRIFSKLDVTHRAEAIVRAREAGFGRTGGSPAELVGPES